MQNIYLIQRCHIIKGYDDKTDIYNALKRDYMGAAEFEFGAIPASIERMKNSFSEYKMSVWNGCDRPQEYALRIWHKLSDEDFEKYKEQLYAIFTGKHRLKEWCYFVKNPTVSMPNSFEAKPEDFWWDIRNDVMWSYDKFFMEKLPAIVLNS